jgi:hypothetical protein
MVIVDAFYRTRSDETGMEIKRLISMPFFKLA